MVNEQVILTLLPKYVLSTAVFEPYTVFAGVAEVIAPGDLTNYVPLYKSSSGDVTTQYDMKGLEDLGLLKLDFLGLRQMLHRQELLLHQFFRLIFGVIYDNDRLD